MTRSEPRPNSRFIFLDVARGLAVLWMIQVHITSVFIDPAIHVNTSFDILNVTNGYVAPTFIFLAGAGFWIAMSRKINDYLHGGKPLNLYVRRLFYILWCAFTLHIPFYSLERTLMASVEELLPGLQVDVLHTIVYSTFVGLAFVFIGRSIKNVTRLSAVAALFVLFSSWWVWTEFPSSSPFPMFPWSFYFFAGVTLTSVFMRSTNKSMMSKIWIASGLLVPVVLFTLKLSTLPAPWSLDIWWKATPSILLFCCTATLTLLGILYLNEDRLQRSRIGKFLQVVGQESLFMYVSHLILVYGKAAQTAQHMIGLPPQGYLGIAMIWMVITIPLLVIMWYWHSIKKDRPELAQRIYALQIIVMTVTYIVVPADFPGW